MLLAEDIVPVKTFAFVQIRLFLFSSYSFTLAMSLYFSFKVV